mmetsp:Transcript_85836/g.268548  ORF Transcript_85836/g.268548 Transcript_85836/m.268548 type:complete len:422 (-) Transcript_85836:184-1449(-)
MIQPPELLPGLNPSALARDRPILLAGLLAGVGKPAGPDPTAEHHAGPERISQVRPDLLDLLPTPVLAPHGQHATTRNPSRIDGTGLLLVADPGCDVLDDLAIEPDLLDEDRASGGRLELRTVMEPRRIRHGDDVVPPAWVGVLDRQLHHVAEPAVVEEVEAAGGGSPHHDEVVVAGSRNVAPPAAVVPVVHQVPEEFVLQPGPVRKLPDAHDIAGFPLREVGHIEHLASGGLPQRGGFHLHPVVKHPLQSKLVLLVQPPEVAPRVLQRRRLRLALPEHGVPKLQVELGGQLVHADAIRRRPHGAQRVRLGCLAGRAALGVARHPVVGLAPASLVEEALEVLEGVPRLEARIPLRMLLDALPLRPLDVIPTGLTLNSSVAIVKGAALLLRAKVAAQTAALVLQRAQRALPRHGTTTLIVGRQ